MNPYDFVPVDTNRPIDRRPPSYHHRMGGISGSISCSITAETPVFVKGVDQGGASHFKKNSNQEYIIPGSSLKGLFRTLVETVGHGCFNGKFDGLYEGKKINYKGHLPDDFKNCPDNDTLRLCVACRLFGWMNGRVYRGKVSFSDAVCPRERAIVHDTINTVDLMGPKPRHRAFYIEGDTIAGRKYYFHFQQGISTEEQKGEYNQRIIPLDKETRFLFDLSFENVEEEELSVLLYALVLEDSMRHKLGYAKPSGLGSCKVKIERISYWTPEDRYLDSNVMEIMNEDAIDRFVKGKIEEIEGDESETMEQLRYIWRWDPQNTTRYRYPGYHWFNNPNNANVRIPQTP